MKSMIALALLCAAPAFAQQDAGGIVTARYGCDRGVVVPATYVSAGEVGVAVITVEGQQITLMQEVSGSGARYGWPSDGAHYIWWIKGDSATLFWSEAGAEDILLNCNVQE